LGIVPIFAPGTGAFMPQFFRPLLRLGALAALLPLSGCVGFPFGGMFMSDRECMTRVMYFESNRSSEEGMIAVGTVVMNRVASRQFPNTICGVVRQPGQFTQSLYGRMHGRGLALASDAAYRVMHGERAANVGGAMYFHTAGLHFPYTNMHYTWVAGGNAFYEKW
jgi:spore germination cell wall hydrolase CwlJ-like protein